MGRFIIQTWEGAAVIRSTFRKAKAELRRAEANSYCASLSRYRGPLPTDSLLEDGEPLGVVSRFYESRSTKD